MKIVLSLLFSLALAAEIIIPQETRQLLHVQSSDFNTTKGTLQAYERGSNGWERVFSPIDVNLGRKGLAWGEGDLLVQQKEDEPLKYEGDGKAPAGLFSLDLFFGYEKKNFNFKYLQVQENDICVDDVHSKAYNQLVLDADVNQYQSYEKMKRSDNLYELGIVVGHNKKRINKRGSCIFIHIQREQDSPTAGCTSMSKENLLRLMQWLDSSAKPLLLQHPGKKDFI